MSVRPYRPNPLTRDGRQYVELRRQYLEVLEENARLKKQAADGAGRCKECSRWLEVRCPVCGPVTG